MSKMQNLYVGSAGQAAVMSEFLFRGYNVAVPEVDRGDDLFVVEDTNGSLSRIQVKAATGKIRKDGSYAAQVNVGLKQLTTPQTPALTYVFVLRCGNRWCDFVVLSQSDLDTLRTNYGVGTKAGNSLVLTMRVTANTVTCSKQDLSRYRNNFSSWPTIKH